MPVSTTVPEGAFNWEALAFGGAGVVGKNLDPRNRLSVNGECLREKIYLK